VEISAVLIAGTCTPRRSRADPPGRLETSGCSVRVVAGVGLVDANLMASSSSQRVDGVASLGGPSGAHELSNITSAHRQMGKILARGPNPS
jgi:hypothetical protein